jgi:hypothetical protein
MDYSQAHYHTSLRPIQIYSLSDKLKGVSRTNEGENGHQVAMPGQNITSTINIFAELSYGYGGRFVPPKKLN